MKYEKYFEKAYRLYVPVTGKADTVPGEVLRCGSRIIHRYYNDGDVYNSGWGKETVNPAVNYLAKCGEPLYEIYASSIKSFAKGRRNWTSEDKRRYESCLNSMADDLGYYSKLLLEGKIQIRKIKNTKK